MSSPASIAKHPVHPMLVAFPIALWVFSLVCDIVRLFAGSEVWSTIALYSMGAGIIGALLAAVPGFVDFLSIEEAAMKRLALTHLCLGLGAVLVFTLNFWLRHRSAQPATLTLLLSILGVVLTGFGGWLGGEMVYVKGMAVEAVERLANQKNPPKSEILKTTMKQAG